MALTNVFRGFSQVELFQRVGLGVVVNGDAISAVFEFRAHCTGMVIVTIGLTSGREGFDLAEINHIAFQLFPTLVPHS